MLLPKNYARHRLSGYAHGHTAVNGCKIFVGGKLIFISYKSARHPGAIRKHLEMALGLAQKPPKTQEEIITFASRRAAQAKRAGHNAAAKAKAKGVVLAPPWTRRRTLAMIVNEEKMLDISQRYSRLGEYR